MNLISFLKSKLHLLSLKSYKAVANTSDIIKYYLIIRLSNWLKNRSHPIYTTYSRSNFRQNENRSEPLDYFDGM